MIIVIKQYSMDYDPKKITKDFIYFDLNFD